MAHVACDERLGASCDRHFQKRTVGLVRQFHAERRRCDTLTHCFEKTQKIRNVISAEAELRAAKYGAVLGQNAVVDEKSDLARQKQIDDAPGIPFGIEEARHDDIRVENDSQAERRRRRTSRISRLISPMVSRLRPVSAAFLRMRDTARIALALRMASTVSANRVSSTPTRTPIGFPFEVRTTSSFESVDHKRPGLFRSSRTLTYLTPEV